VDQLFKNYFDGLGLALTSEHIQRICQWRDIYVQTNKHPQTFTNRTKTIESYDRAIGKINEAKDALSALERPEDFNRIVYSMGNSTVKYAKEIDVDAWQSDEARYIIPAPNTDYLQSYIDHLEQCDIELNQVKKSLSNLPKGRTGINSDKYLRINEFLRELYQIYISAGGKSKITNNNYDDDKPHSGNLMSFIQACLKGIPLEFVPSNKSLGDRLRRAYA